MDWQQKAAALEALSEISIRTRGLNDWYVNQSVEIGKDGGGVLSGEYGNGSTPQKAIEDHWHVLVEGLAPDEYIVINARTKYRQHVRWNGFMWENV